MSSTEKSNRPGWDEYFLGIAKAVAARADCRRAKFGAVIVKDNRIVSTGYNGAPSGAPGCLEGACPRAFKTWDEVPQNSNFDNCISIHAESNSLLYADRDHTKGAVIYINKTDDTERDCLPCSWDMKLMKGAGIVKIVYADLEGNPVIIDL